MKGQKALAFTKLEDIHEYRWVAKYAANNSTLEQAKAKALEMCEKRRRRKYIKKRCEVYFKENTQIKEFEIN